MSDEEHQFESKADAGASKTYPQQAGTIRKNGYIVIKGRPCKVYLDPSLIYFFFNFFNFLFLTANIVESENIWSYLCWTRFILLLLFLIYFLNNFLFLISWISLFEFLMYAKGIFFFFCVYIYMYVCMLILIKWLWL